MTVDTMFFGFRNAWGTLASLGVVIVLAVLMTAVGVPGAVAVPLAMALVGGGWLLLRPRFGQFATACAVVWLLFAGIAVFYNAVRAFGGAVGTVVGVVVLALVVGLMVALRRGVRHAGTVRAGNARNEFAQQRQFQYQPQAEVPVPGPYSAALFISVPTEARTTTGNQVVTGSSRTMPVTVFDRTRAGGSGETQTVWLVRLPMSLPYLSSAFVQQAERAGPAAEIVDGPDPFFSVGTRAPNVPADLGRALLDPSVSGAVRALGGTRWWIEGQYLCCVETNPAGGAPPVAVADRLDRLTSLAAHLPWPRLSGYAAQQ